MAERFVFKKLPPDDTPGRPRWPTEAGGYWRMWRDRVYLSCPRCELPAALSAQHRVEADGRVEPSVFHDAPECGFHEFVMLEGWATPST